MPAKKTPAKKAAPPKKSAKKVTKSGTATTFGLIITPGGAVLVNGSPVTSLTSSLPSGSGLTIVPLQNPPPGSQSTPGISVIVPGALVKTGFGFHMPIGKKQAKLIFDLSIFNKIKRTTNQTVPTIDASSNNGTIFNTGIEG
jgi:hypothetical protein